ncbi:MAG: hypothetical protein IH866_00230 [Chloroflexi bacterium]|nr:hypothetical protein [Chloroflexota bacterium]
MASEIWRSTFNMLGLATYLTIMTGELPDRYLLSAARTGEYGRSGSPYLAAPVSEPQPPDEAGDLAHPVAATDV